MVNFNPYIIIFFKLLIHPLPCVTLLDNNFAHLIQTTQISHFLKINFKIRIYYNITIVTAPFCPIPSPSCYIFIRKGLSLSRFFIPLTNSIREQEIYALLKRKEQKVDVCMCNREYQFEIWPLMAKKMISGSWRLKVIQRVSYQ